MKRFNIKLPGGSLVFSIASVGYLVLMGFLTGLRPEHWIIVFALNIMFYAGIKTRKFILGFAIFVVFAMLYDIMRAFPNYLYHSVDISGLYNLEKTLFGIPVHGFLLTPNEFFAANHCAVADLFSGFFYINWMPVPIGFAIYLFFTDRKLFLHFSLTFLFVNLIGFCIYYIHPAAPPWYVSQHGFDLNLHTPGSAAGLTRFDQLIHLNVFGSIYSKNSNVFAAIPSLHCAYPLIVLYYGIKGKCRGVNYLFALFTLGIWFSAVYSGHHYILDVILGILCAVVGIGLYERILKDQRFYNKFVNRYYTLIS
jgi:inositol phosphorylceramide synthase catalytic subunit